MSAQKRPVRECGLKDAGVKVEGGVHTHILTCTQTHARARTCEARIDFGMALTAPQTQFLPRGRRAVRKCKANKHSRPSVRKHRRCRVFRTLSFKQGPSGTSVAGLQSQVLASTATSLYSQPLTEGPATDWFLDLRETE